MKRHICTYFLAVLLISCYMVASSPSEKSSPSLRATFEKYVGSIQKSDLRGLFETVTENEKFFFLTASGQLINTRQGYYKFHQEWFQEKDWEMPVELLEVHEGQDYGYTTAIFHYFGKTPVGVRYFLDSYFTLIFRREKGNWRVVADVCTPISRSYADADPGIRYSSDQMFLLDTIKNRRTVRRFKPTPVPRQHVLKILDAARHAPTAGNQQPWKFLVVQDRQKLDLLRNQAISWYLEALQKRGEAGAGKLETAREAVGKALDGALSAPTYIAVLVDSQSKYPEWIIHDGALATENLMIAARALGYGTGFFTSFFPEAKMKEFFRIPDRYRLICFTPVGIPEEWPQPPSKKTLDELVVFEGF